MICSPVILVILVLSVLLISSYILISRNVPNRKQFFWIFLIGSAGWLIAYFVRLPIIGIVQDLVLMMLGANLQNAQSVALFSSNVWVLIWGPIFAGIFEER